MKLYFFYLIILLFLLSGCDNIDNLSLIAGLGYFEMYFIEPAYRDQYETGDDCLIKWQLPEKRAKNVSLELIKDDAVVYTISSKTENDGEYLWKKIKVQAYDDYKLRLSIIDGVYTGKNRECRISIVEPSIDSRIIYFVDENLEQAIKDIIGKTDGDIFKDDVKDIT